MKKQVFRKKTPFLVVVLLLVNVWLPFFGMLEKAHAISSYTPGDWQNAVFTPYTTSLGQPYFDPAGESGVSPDDVDFTSGTNQGEGDLPSYYVATGTNNLYFRMRLKSNPYDRKGGFLSSVWMVKIGLNGSSKPFATVGVDGKSPSDDFVYVANGDGTNVTHIYDTESNSISQNSPIPGTRIVSTTNGQYFLDFQVPITAIKALSSSLTATTPIQLHFATSKAANLSVVNKDGEGNQVNPIFGNAAAMTLNQVPLAIAIDGGGGKNYDASDNVMEGTSSLTSGTVKVNFDGTSTTVTVTNHKWSFTIPPTYINGGNGTYMATVSETSDNQTVTASQMVTISDSSSTGAISIDGGIQAITNTPSLTISGTDRGPNGSKVILLIDGKQLSGKVNANNGVWSSSTINLPNPNEGKVYNVQAEYVNSNGAPIYATATQKLTYKTSTTTVSPPTVGINQPILGGAIPTITGTSTNANQVKIQIDGVTVGIETPTSSGTWSVSLEEPISITTHRIRAIAENSEGGTATASTSYTVSTTSISLDNGDETQTNDNQPTISGRTNATPGSQVTVQIKNSNGSLEPNEIKLYTATVANDHTWRMAYPNSSGQKLADGTYTVTATVGTASATQQLKVDTSTKVSIMTPSNGSSTTNLKPKISGTSEANDTITLNIDNGAMMTTVFADENGNWSYIPTQDFSINSHTIQVVASDKNGNVAQDTTTFTVTPIPTTLNVTGKAKLLIPVSGSKTTSNYHASVSGETITWSLVNNPTGVTIDSNGEVTVNSTVSPGTMTVKATDANGTLSGTKSVSIVRQQLDDLYINQGEPPFEGNYTLKKGETHQTIVTAVNQDESLIDETNVATYTSSDSNVLTISSNGLVTAGNPGSATITITYGDITKTQTIKVTSVATEPPFTLKLKATPSSVVGNGKSKIVVKATVMSKDTPSTPVEGVPVTFKLNDGTISSPIQTDSNGVATFTITAPSINGIKTVSDVMNVVATDPNDPTLKDEQNILIHYMPATVHGILINQQTGQPISGATISVTADFNGDGINDFSEITTTEADGSYSVAVPRGNFDYQLNITKQIKISNQTVDVKTTQSAPVGAVTGVGQSIDSMNKITGQLMLSQPSGSTQSGSTNSVLSDLGTVNVKVVGKTNKGLKYKESAKVSSNGIFNLDNVPLGQYKVSYQITSANGSVLVGPSANVNVKNNGEVSVVYNLIDPYGTVTNSLGTPIPNVHMTLYWANTPLNITNGHKPGMEVNLPNLPKYQPNQNANPQDTNASGQYGWMVYPNGDYYIIATKNGYETYDSRVAKPNVGSTSDDSYIKNGMIHIGNSLESLSFHMTKVPNRNISYSFTQPDKPKNLNATTINDSEIKLQWDAVSNVDSYNIYQNGKLVATGVTSPNYTVSALTPQTQYTFSVVAVKEGIDSPHSNTVKSETLKKPELISHSKYIHGYKDGTFRPNKPIIRVEVAAMLYSLYHLDNIQTTDIKFSDINNSYWGRKIIDAVIQKGFMTGYKDGTFRPRQPVTRAEMAAIIARVKKLQLPVKNYYSDISDNGANNAIDQVTAAGIMKGYPNGTFRPNQLTSRSEAVIAINRMADRGPLVGAPQTWPDVPPSYWAYNDIEEASINHTSIIEHNVEKWISNQ